MLNDGQPMAMLHDASVNFVMVGQHESRWFRVSGVGPCIMDFLVAILMRLESKLRASRSGENRG